MKNALGLALVAAAGYWIYSNYFSAAATATQTVGFLPQSPAVTPVNLPATPRTARMDVPPALLQDTTPITYTTGTRSGIANVRGVSQANGRSAASGSGRG